MSKIDLFLSDPRYIALDNAGKKAALDRYFYKYVPQDSRYQALDEEGKKATHQKFMDKYYGVAEPEQAQPKQRSLKEMMSPQTLGTPQLGAQLEPADKTNVAAVENYMADKYKGDANVGYERGQAEARKNLKSGNILSDMGEGFMSGINNILATGEMIGALASGDKYEANHIQGYMDEQLKIAGYGDMDMGKAIKEGDIKKVGGMALRTFSQSAPVTLLWLLNNFVGDVATLAPTAVSKYTQLDREMPELSEGKKLGSALNAGFWAAASEEIGNRIAFLNKYVRTGSKMGKAAITSLIKKEISKTAIAKAGMGVGLGTVGEGAEELLSFNGEYWGDVLLGITEPDMKAYIAGSVNSTLLGMSAGGIQGGMTATYSNIVNARYTNLQSKLEKAADIDLTKITDQDKWNAAKNLKQLAQNTQTAIEFAQGGDTEAALQLAKENLSIANKIVGEEGSSAISSVGMYNAILVDTLTEYQTKEEGLPVKKVVQDKVYEAAAETKPEQPTPSVQSDYTSIQALVDKAAETKTQADVDAANQAIQTAIASGDRSEDIQVLQTAMRTVKVPKSKPKAVKPAEPAKAIKPEVKAEPKDQYEAMSYNELRTEGTKRKLYKVGMKTAEIAQALRDSDAKQAEAPKAEDEAGKELRTTYNHANGRITVVNKPGQPNRYLAIRISQDQKQEDKEFADENEAKAWVKEGAEPASKTEGIKLETKQSKGMAVGKIDETTDRRDPAESNAIETKRLGKVVNVKKKNISMPIRYALIDRDRVVASHSTGFQENENYPQEIQNRQRNKASLQGDTQGLASTLDPDRLMENAIASDGRPIVIIDKNDNPIALTGNGRIIAMNIRAESEKGLSEYEDRLKERLSEFGISDQDTKGKMLVGVYYGDENLVELARLLNEGEQKKLSKTEMASSDATLIANSKKDGKDILLDLDMNTQSLMSAANEPFIEKFIDLCIPDTAGYKTDSGAYTTELEQRIENALFMYVFNNNERAGRLLGNYRETGESNVKYVLNGIMDNIKQIARLRNLIEKHNLLDLDITNDLVVAISEIDDLKAKGISVEEKAYEMDLFSANQEYIPDNKLALYQSLLSINSNVKSNQFIGGYYSDAYDAINPDQMTLLSSLVESKEQFLNDYCNGWLRDMAEKSKGGKNDKGTKAKDTTSTLPKDVGKNREGTKGVPDKGKPKAKAKPVAPQPAAETKITDRQSFQSQWRASQPKLTPEQLDAQLEIVDAFMNTFAKEMNMTLDEAYAIVEQIGTEELKDALNQVTAEYATGAAIETDEVPQKTVRAYRLGWLNPDGTVSSVKVDESKATRQYFKMGVRYKAEVRKSDMANIPGFHFAYLPSLPQLYKKDGTLESGRVYYIAEYDASKSYQAEADATKEGFLRGKIPEGGFYFRRSGKIKEWAISGSMMPIRVLTMEEVDEINRKAGLETKNGYPIALAKKKGITLNQALAAQVKFRADNKIELAFINPDITSGMHEMAHIGRRMMAVMAQKSPKWQTLNKAAEDWSGANNGEWSTEADEKFANGFLKYLHEGTAPNSKLKTVFEKIKQWFSEAINRLRDFAGLTLNQDIIGVYDALLGKQPLTRKQKVEAVKAKSASTARAVNDPAKLQTEMDKLANQKGLVLQAKKTGASVAMYLIDVDKGNTIIEIHHKNGEYEVNGFHAEDNADAMEKVNELLASTVLNQGEASILNQAMESATPEARERIAKINEAARNAQIRARATYRNLRTKMNTSTVVATWESLMRKALITSIKNSFPGTAPLNMARYEALKEQLSELDPGIEEEGKEIARIKRKLRQMIRNDERFREALQEVSGGFDNVANIPFEQLFTALSNTNASAYDAFMNDETMAVILKILPDLKEGFGGEYNDKTLQMIVNSFLTDGNPYWGVADWKTTFIQPQRYLTTIFGRAGATTIDLAYQGTLANSAYEHEYEPYLNDLHRLLMTDKNNRGSAYEGAEGDIIGRTIFEVDGDSKITDKLPTIQRRLADWSEANSIINPQDVAEIYAAKEKIKETIKDFIIEWNADPRHTRKIGIREDYDNPRNYKWGNISEITTKFGRYLFTPANAKKRAAEDFNAGLPYNANIFEAYRNYAYAMTKYMAFADLANYVEDSTVAIPIKDKEKDGHKIMRKKMGSQFDLDLSLAQRHASSAAREYLANYIKDVIGYHKHNSPGDRLLSALRSNLYTSTLSLNLVMTVLNYNQRNLIFSVVDPKIAWQVKNDFNFWSGLFNPKDGKYSTLASVMQRYVIANQSLLAELSAEVKQNAEIGRTKMSRAYYSNTAKYNELLKQSMFSRAELGNRAWAHAAGVYQVVQNSPAYKANIEAGMSVHEAMDKALENDKALQRAATTYGGIVNAEINADANPAFAPAMFREHAKMNKLAAFLRYGTTITLLELRTYGGAKDLKSAISPDLFNLLMSGNVQAATIAQTIQAAQIMKSWTSPDRVAKMVKDFKVSKTSSPEMLSIEQMSIVHNAISWALDEYAKSAEDDFANIVRGKHGAKKRMAAMFTFSLAEMFLRLILEVMMSLLPWWQGKKKFADTDIIYNMSTILGLFQTTKTAANYRLGVGLIPDINYYNRSNKQVLKAITQTVMRLTPFAGTANYAGKLFMGKYFSDQFWDALYE